MYTNEYYRSLDIVKQPGMATPQALLEAVRIVASYEGKQIREIEETYKLYLFSHYQNPDYDQS